MARGAVGALHRVHASCFAALYAAATVVAGLPFNTYVVNLVPAVAPSGAQRTDGSASTAAAPAVATSPRRRRPPEPVRTPRTEPPRRCRPDARRRCPRPRRTSRGATRAPCPSAAPYRGPRAGATGRDAEARGEGTPQSVDAAPTVGPSGGRGRRAGRDRAARGSPPLPSDVRPGRRRASAPSPLNASDFPFTWYLQSVQASA